MKPFSVHPGRKALLASLLASTALLTGCAAGEKPPQIAYDDAAPAVLATDPPKPIQIVELPKPLPLPGQLKPVAGGSAAPELADPTARVNQANDVARVQGEMPPLFVVGPSGAGELVNYRVRGNHMIVDRLFAAAELRMGDKNAEQRVRISRTDGRPRS
ncbi:MAG: TrbG/VirB9 family P-type conjugative transfer protein [Proteobacteria bacterium]|nr:TrbG/VirB9 family P-type conjugative transfer protein [Pseudomonadota bacterium]